MPRFALLCLLVLSACGVDGAPQAPTGMTMSGGTEMGVARDGG